jgi:hypothetical protein
VPFVFGNLHARGVERYTGGAAERKGLSDLVQNAWLAFARTGDPNHPGLPPWPAYGAEARATLLLDADPSVQMDPLSEERTVWDGVPFDGVNPAIGNCVPTTREILASFLKLARDPITEGQPPGRGDPGDTRTGTTRVALQRRRHDEAQL